MTKITLPLVPTGVAAGNANNNHGTDPQGRWHGLLQNALQNAQPNGGENRQPTSNPDAAQAETQPVDPTPAEAINGALSREARLAAEETAPVKLSINSGSAPTAGDGRLNQNAQAVLIPALALPTGRLSLVPMQGGCIGMAAGTAPDTGGTAEQHAPGASPYSQGASSAGRQTATDRRLHAVAADALSRSASAVEKATAGIDRTSTMAASSTDWLARRLQLVAREGLVDIRLRDYRLSPEERAQLVQALLAFADNEDIALRQITVNGDVIWNNKTGFKLESDSGTRSNNHG